MTDYIVKRTDTFIKWYKKLKDKQAQAIIAKRLTRIEIKGQLGDIKHLKDDVYEMRFFTGAGYRIYYWHDKDKQEIILLLCGGDKSTQKRDIDKALKIKTELAEQETEQQDD